jgi:hypothetical protein
LAAPTGAAHDLAAAQLRDLAGDAADRTRRAGDEYGFAILHGGGAEQPDVGGHARHAEHAEIGRWRRRERAECGQFAGRRVECLAPAVIAEHRVARLEPRIGRRHDPADGAAGECLADLEGWHVGLAVHHAAAHVGIDAHAQVAYLHRARFGVRHVDRDRLEVIG